MIRLSLLTIRQFSKKYNVPENILRSMCKRGVLPGFYEKSRFYINEEQAVEFINQMSKQKTENMVLKEI